MNPLKPLFRDLGVGVGLRPTHFHRFKTEKPKTVSWVEVISENYMPWNIGSSSDLGFQVGTDDRSSSIEMLSEVRKDLSVNLHGVCLNIGSTDKLDSNYIKNLKELIEMIEPDVVSDHLSWTGVQGINTHDLLPIPYTYEELKNICEKIDFVQNYLGRRILLENPSSYFEFQNSEMSECEFIAELADAADCGLLLDINNVYVSSVNHGFNPFEYLKKIPHHRVGQIHLAGHSKMKGYLIDTHDEDICEEVWELYSWYRQFFGLASTMIERDGNVPEWDVLEKEILMIANIRNQRNQIIDLSPKESYTKERSKREKSKRESDKKESDNYDGDIVKGNSI